MVSDRGGERPTVALGTPLWVIWNPLTTYNSSVCLGGCICVSAAALLQEWEQTCERVYINFGHFRGLSNKNMTKRWGECGICSFFPSAGTPQDFYFVFWRVFETLWPVLEDIIGSGHLEFEGSHLVDGYCFQFVFYVVKHGCMETLGAWRWPMHENKLWKMFQFVGFANRQMCCDIQPVRVCVCMGRQG